MYAQKLLALALLSLFVMVSSAFAQSTSLGLGAQLTTTNATIGLGGSVAISGDSIVVAQNGGGQYHTVYVFQRRPNGWVSETQTA